MLNNEAQAATSAVLLSPVSAANTAAATGSWVSIADAEGDVMVTASCGAITGSIVWSVEHADDNSGTNSAAVTPSDGAFGAVSANTVQKRCFSANALKPYIRLKGTIVTGPVLVGGVVSYRPKIV